MRRLRTSIALSFVIALLGCHSIRDRTHAPGRPGDQPISQPQQPPADPKLVELDATLDRSAIESDTSTHVTTRLRLSAGVAKAAKRAPLGLVLLVDTSGSMAGQAIADARAAAKEMIGALHTGDRVAIVTFDTRAEVLVSTTEIGKDGTAAITRRIGAMQARGTTDMAAGLQAAFGQLGNLPADGVRRIVMLSDGVPNDATAIAGLAQSARASGIAITALGFGLEYDETLLASVAQATGGAFHRVREGDALADAFVDEVFRVERVVASNVVLTLNAGPGVSIERVLGQAALPPGTRQHSLVLGDLSERQHQDVFVELSVTGHRDGANIELVDASVGFDERAVGAGRLERRSFVAVQATKDDEALANARNLEIERGAARARVASAIIDAVALANGGQFGDAGDLLERVEKDSRARAKDDAELREHLEEVTRLRKAFAAEAKAQAAANRELARKPKSSGGAKTVPSTMPSPAPSVAPEVADRIKESHARAVDMMQPGS